MKTALKISAIAFLLLIAGGCTKEGESDSGGAEEGYATGKVTDGQGEPLAGAKILLDNTVHYASYIQGSTKEDGTYKVKVQPGSWRTFAYVQKTYNGETYQMELFPDKTDAFADEGAVRNFTWKLEGRMPWEAESYYGGTVMLTSDIGFYEDDEDIELTFTPDGALIDGSAGHTLTLRYGGEKWQNRYELRDIPIGRYKVKATLKKNGTDRLLKIENWHKRDGFVSEFQLDFIPKPSGTVENSASIVIGY